MNARIGSLAQARRKDRRYPKVSLILTAVLLSAPFSLGAQSLSGQEPADMVLIKGGSFAMGFAHAYKDELPVHEVTLRPFYLDRHEVTNAQFRKFVDATHYVTQAEKEGYCWAYIRGAAGWEYVAGVNWRHPEGPQSSINSEPNHPISCVNWFDASAYVKWAGKRLPTEAEWEYAARAGSAGQFVADVDTINNAGTHMASEHMNHGTSDQSPSSKSHTGMDHHGLPTFESRVTANIWEGHWPDTNKLLDGFFYTAPVESFAANPWGIYDMLGNVWEWTADWYDSTYYSHSPLSNPQGQQAGDKRVARGGSWFCSPNYCGAYSSHYRGASPPDHAFNNVGFRCAMDAPDDRK